jgi:hypothetical protein
LKGVKVLTILRFLFDSVRLFVRVSTPSNSNGSDIGEARNLVIYALDCFDRDVPVSPFMLKNYGELKEKYDG